MYTISQLVTLWQLVMLNISLLIFHFIPSIIAFRRHHHNKWPVFLLNLFLGWTFIGWIIALVWSATATNTK
jgi:hypothetical protein